MKKEYSTERLMKIMEIIRRESKVDVDGLAELFRVSQTTIRSDLRDLEKRDLITRTHGGALLRDEIENSLNVEPEPNYYTRLQQNLTIKEKIGRAAASIIRDGDSIMLDDGSTTLQVAKHLSKEKTVHVVTNGLNISLELVKHPKAEVISAGGILRKEDMSCYGKVAQETVARFNTNKAILGASGISFEQGITSPDELKAELKRIMIQQSKELIIVADHTKLNNITLINVCPLERISTLITDKMAPPDIVDRLREYGMQVILAD